MVSRSDRRMMGWNRKQRQKNDDGVDIKYKQNRVNRKDRRTWRTVEHKK